MWNVKYSLSQVSGWSKGKFDKSKCLSAKTILIYRLCNVKIKYSWDLLDCYIIIHKIYSKFNIYFHFNSFIFRVISTWVHIELILIIEIDILLILRDIRLPIMTYFYLSHYVRGVIIFIKEIQTDNKKDNWNCNLFKSHP